MKAYKKYINEQDTEKAKEYIESATEKLNMAIQTIMKTNKNFGEKLKAITAEIEKLKIGI